MALKFAAGGALAGVAAYGLYQLNQPKKDQLKMIVSGGPGSGKGTQCELLVNKYGLKHISTGDALRHHVKTGTDLGREAKAYMERGDLVPDSLVIGICEAEMQTPEAKKNGWLLDGMPRTKAQCDALDDMGLVPNLFLRLDVPDDVMMDRACGRRQDPVTRQIYHVKYKKPPTEEIEKRLVIRSDDTVEKMTNRIRQYHKNTTAVSGSYSDKLVVVDGNRAPKEVFPAVCAAIDNALAK
jgi:adenylate kinase